MLSHEDSRDYIDKTGCRAVKIDNKETVGDAVEGVSEENIARIYGLVTDTAEISTTSALELVKYAYRAEPRPNNIGIGTFNKTKNNKLRQLNKISKYADDFFKGAAIGTLFGPGLGTIAGLGVGIVVGIVLEKVSDNPRRYMKSWVN